MSYKKWFGDYIIAIRRDSEKLRDTSKRTYEARKKVLEATFAGEYGRHVKHSVFGIGDCDIEDICTDEMKLLSNMKFYAELEKK